MINPAMLIKVKGMWDRFKNDHPKFPRFLQAMASQKMEEGTILEMNVIRPNGDTLATNIRLTASDLELLEQLKQLGMNQRQ